MPPTPINLSVLCSWLSHNPNREAADLLLNGFTRGFTLEFNGPRVSRDSDCLSSAAQQPQVVEEKLHKEITLGRIAVASSNYSFVIMFVMLVCWFLVYSFFVSSCTSFEINIVMLQLSRIWLGILSG